MANSEIIAFSIFGRQLYIENNIYIFFKQITAGQVSCQATGNSPGSLDGLSAPVSSVVTVMTLYIKFY